MQFDLIVVGGGINGAGIARDAALRGLRTCLIEQGDLCNGTTRWSSRLIHGGLRYLEFGELGLVHESLQERENLLRNAPHLVRPLPLLIPVYEDARRGMNTVDFGLYVYDVLSIGRSVPGHRRLSRDEALAEMPGIRAEGLTGAVVYFDAQVTHVERLVVENALSAAAAGASIETWTAVDKVLLEKNHVTGVEVRNVRTGARSTRHATAVVNAAGPWVDRILAAAGRPLPRFLGPTKGTHIVVRPFPGITHTACYAEARSDGRPFFIIPWNGLVLIGTTDTRTDEDPARLRPTAAEVDYLLTETRNTFPACGLDRDAVLYAYCGLRPLPRQGIRETASITRRHQIRQHGRSARGLTSVIGGKITTYRHLAEEVVDRVVPKLPVTARGCTTADTPLPGAGATADEVFRELALFPHVPVASHAHLYGLYGSRAPLVAALTRDAPELGQPLAEDGGAIAAEVVFAVRGEFAVTLGDVLLRRCMAGLAPDLGRSALPRAVATAARHLGW
ncbi:MAG: glycerol-3-phosphate dehydrogenase, partial [Gammaproteobacteria bacterium]|nr:glycerol-3-phosphate dehydrogenase [Gammaproteobacteria bacterium]